MNETIRLFTEKPLKEAAVELVKKLGFQCDPTLSNVAMDDFFKQNDFTFKYLNDIKDKIEHIWDIGLVDYESYNQHLEDEDNKYISLEIFACEINSEVTFTRGMAANLTRAFNRINTSYFNKCQNTGIDTPVIVIIKQGNLLSIATCERSERKDGTGDKVGKVTILRNMNCEKLHPGHRQILERIANEVSSCSRYDELYQKWFNSFSIDLLSDRFFEGYKSIYEDIIEYVTGKRMIKKSGKWVEQNNGKPCAEIMEEFADFDNPEKAVRDYVKNLMGRLVFIQFLQKKGWMGVPAGDSWTGGDPEFIQNLFKKSDKKETFIDDVLEPLFNDLNTKRHGDLVTNQNIGIDIKIPYLNGGLFELDKSDDTHFAIPSFYLQRLFDFFLSFNFTVDENAPDDVEIGVDPEMLGRIFENLLEDNKEKGAFYTPKEIVFYMCRESLVAYLTTCILKKQGETHKPESTIKKAIHQLLLEPETIVPRMTEEQLNDFGNYIRNVKICDPAIGSGAFPMGLLNELVRCRKIIGAWAKDSYGNSLIGDDAALKAEIICNNIYGVDIEKGAIDIARLRFWLSIIVDEKTPQALPNFDYKFMQGNSLIPTFGGQYINLSTKGQKHINVNEMIAVKKKILAYKRDFYVSSGEEKQKLNILIKDNILQLISLQLGYEIKAWASAHPEQLQVFDKQPEISIKEVITQLPEERKRIVDLGKSLRKELSDTSISAEHRAQTDIQFFDWRLMFTEIFDIEDGNGGFDIVIGNPPYGVSIQGEYRNSVVGVLGNVPDFEIYYYFIEISKRLLKNNGLLSYIIPNTWLFNTFAKNYRSESLNYWKIDEILDCSKFKIFKSATVNNTIFRFIRTSEESDLIGYRNTNSASSFEELIKEPYSLIPKKDVLGMNQNWGLIFRLDKPRVALVNKISNCGQSLETYFPEISQGLIAYDKYRGQSEEIIRNRAYHFSEYHDGLKKMIWGEDVTRYSVNWNGQEWIDYCEGIANPRQPKFFVGKRLLVREITNPSIFATITEEELYNDPAVIIVLDSPLYTIETALGILNSKLATFYHFNHSPKATKGSFPKILVQDIKEFPLPYICSDVDKKITNNVNEILKGKLSSKEFDSSVLEHEIDCLVYELYGLTNAEVKVISPNEVTSGTADELFKV